MAADTLERIVPETVLVHRDGQTTLEPVTRMISHPPGQAPDGAPIVRTLWALELQTARDSRWYGFTRAPWIGPDLRMHVVLDSDRDEVRNGWERPDQEPSDGYGITPEGLALGHRYVMGKVNAYCPKCSEEQGVCVLDCDYDLDK
jgi:hypothetical protein